MKVLTDTESLTAVADAIRAKSGGDEPLVFPEGFVEAVEGIEGGNSYYDTFWDAFQQNGERGDYEYAFYNLGWNEITFRPKYDMKPTTAQSMFRYSQMTDLKTLLTELGITLDLSGCTHIGLMIANSKITKFPTIDASALQSRGILYAFNRAHELQEVSITNIKSDLDLKESFVECYKLQNLMVSGSIGTNFGLSSCSLLTSESVQSVIDALADLTGASTQTLSLHADVKAALSEQQLVSITQKNWTVA